MKARRWLFALVWAIVIPYLVGIVWKDVSQRSLGVNTLLGLPFMLAYGAVGTMVVDREPRNPVGWTFLLAFVLSAANGIVADLMRLSLGPLKEASLLLEAAFLHAYLSEVVGSVGWNALAIFPLVFFPHGKLPGPRWRPFVRLVAGLMILRLILGVFTSDLSSSILLKFRNPLSIPAIDGPADLMEAVLFVATVIAPLSLVLRLRKARGVERQQIKWPLLSASIGFIGLGWLLVVYLAYTVLGGALPDGPGPLTDIPLISVGTLLGWLAAISYPITVGIAILRYRLYDIDLIIRKTLQYALISGILALVYFGGVVRVQAAIRAATGQDSPLLVVISTLAIAMLFVPLRTWVQTFIDRRFYRTKYDAARTLEAFAAAARHETDLEHLSARLEQVVQDAVQPASISLWLRSGPADGPTPRGRG